jgi:hypothetical protein
MKKIKELVSTMDMPLLSPITHEFADLSTPEVFAFSFFCDNCGREWHSEMHLDDPCAIKPPTDPGAYDIWREGRYRAAYERANLEAAYEFFYCPECGRRLCMECFCRSETDAADVCKGCLSLRV